MKREPRRMARPVTVSLAVLFLLFPYLLRGEQIDSLDDTVQHLIRHVSESGLIFIRNAEVHTAVEAAEHMSKKYRHFRRDIETAEDFIELCASRSLLSGQPYLVINKEGKQIKTSEWLRAELANYSSHHMAGTE